MSLLTIILPGYPCPSPNSTATEWSVPGTPLAADHPLHSAYIAKNEAALAWFAEKRDASAAAA
jgi:hypothetical protein